jgi:exopolyphosphatase/pppGpp-phosphohydrolase
MEAGRYGSKRWLSLRQPKSRADVILPGVVIYEAVMKEFGFKLLRISTRSPRFAVVMD